MKKTTRRNFIYLANAGFVALLLFIWNKITLNYIKKVEQKERILLYSKNQKVSFSENYIVINQKEKVIVLSSHCTHLGCQINNLENNKLICPCHGSEYDLDGKVIKGPAFKNLPQVKALVSADRKSIEILS